MSFKSAFCLPNSLQLKYQGNLMCLHYSQNLMNTWGHPFSSNVSDVRESKNFQLSSATHKLIKVSYNSNIKKYLITLLSNKQTLYEPRFKFWEQ